MDHLFEQVGLGQEIGVEDGDEPARRGPQAVFECAGFVTIPASASNVLDVKTEPALFFDLSGADRLSFIGRIIQYLNLKKLFGVTKIADGVDQAFDDVHFIVYRQLDRQFRQYREMDWRGRRTLFVSVVKEKHEVGVNTVTAQDDERPVVQDQPNVLVPNHSLFPSNSQPITQRRFPPNPKDDRFHE